MSSQWTLPMVQERLDELFPDPRFALSPVDCERLFGLNDVAARRIVRFAEGHQCDVIFTPRETVFRKR